MLPIIITCVAPRVAEELQSLGGLRPAFGVCTAALYASCIPIAGILFVSQPRFWESDQASEKPTTAQEPSRPDRARRFAMELDFPGVILAIAGLCMILLPPAHFARTEESWQYSTINVMIGLGTFSLLAFCFWEYRLASANYSPWSLMRDRNILGGCLVVMFTAISTACWGSYYSSHLQVVNDQPSTTAASIAGARPAAFVASAPFIGL